MHSANLVLWIAGLALQTFLVIILFRRRMVPLYPLFSCLIVFYILRSVLYYVLASQKPPAPHKDLHTVLSWVDLFLQILLVIEISVRSWSRRERSGDSNWGKAALQLVIEAVLAAGVALLLPEPTRVRIDRGVVFIMIVMSLRLIWMVRHRMRGFPRDIAAGFALYGAAVTATAWAQNRAFHSQNAMEYTAVSYANAIVYIGIVVFWIIALRAKSPHNAETRSPKSSRKARRAG